MIWRYTYGFKRKEHDLSSGFLSKATGYNKRQIEREIAKLVERKIIFQKVVNGVSRTLAFNKDYDQWLTSGELADGQKADGELVPKPPAKKPRVTTGKLADQEINNIKQNKQIYTPDFELFWSKYPRKVAKKVAFQKWNKVAKSEAAKKLITQCAENYARTCADKKTEEQYILHPSTFLNQERYLDYEIYIEPYKPTNKKVAPLPTVSISDEEVKRLDAIYKKRGIVG